MTLADIIQAINEASPYVLAVLVSLTALSKVLQSGAHALDRWARRSAAKWDDKPASALAKAADWTAACLDAVVRFLPTIGMGPRR